MGKRKRLTPEDVREWIDDTEGVECPMCGSSDVDFDMPDWESGGMYQRGECKKCKAAWCEGYTLDRVAVEGADGQYGEFVEAAPPAAAPGSTTIREALMRAYVAGWQDGRENSCTTDEGKFSVADELAREIDSNEAAATVSALRALVADVERLRHFDTTAGVKLLDRCRAAIARAEGKESGR